MSKKWYIKFLKSSRDLNPAVTENRYGEIYLKVGRDYFTAFDQGVKTREQFRTKKVRQEYMDRINAAAGEVVAIAAGEQ